MADVICNPCAAGRCADCELWCSHEHSADVHRVRTQAERDADRLCKAADHTRCTPALCADAAAALFEPRRPRIVVDPAVRFGHPHIDGTHAATIDVAGMIAAGETVATVADEYDLTPHQVLLACWYEGMDGHYQALFGEWAMTVQDQLASGQTADAVPAPPADMTCRPPRRRWWHRYARTQKDCTRKD